MLRIIAAALADEPLGAPQTISVADDTTYGDNGDNGGIIFKSNGSYAKYLYGTPVDINYWIAPQTNFSEYEIRATLLSGDTPVGTLDTWEALDTTRTWRIRTLTPLDFVNCSLLIEIRWTGNNVVQDSATYSISGFGPPS